MSRAPEDFAESHSLGQAVEKRRSRCGWLVAYGGLCVFFGAPALGLVETSSFAMVFLIAPMPIVAGGAEILLGFNSRDWPSFFLRLISGLFYLVFGGHALARQEVAAAVVGVRFSYRRPRPNLARLEASRRSQGHCRAGRRDRDPARRADPGWLAGPYADRYGNPVRRRFHVLRFERDRARPPAQALTGPPVAEPQLYQFEKKR
jgi:hypothetical protein